ncbi:MAG: hypothetical protein MJ133_05265, partial [Lachnospiraceae bacterium]|nr:hypothetical protein [Lachnospiraceae bacterium]
VQPTGYPGPIPGNGVQPTGYPGPKPGQGMTPVGVNVPGRAGTDTQNMLNNKPFDPSSMIPSDINDDLD